MKSRLSWIAAVMVVAALPLRLGARISPIAQVRCRGRPVPRRTSRQDACQQAFDIFSSWRRSSASRSPAATRRWHGRRRSAASATFPIGVRVNAFSGMLPDRATADPGQHDRRAARTAADEGPVVRRCRPPTRRSARSRAFRSASPTSGGVDALVSAEYVPTHHNGNVSLDPSSQLPVRIRRADRPALGIDRVPGVSFTWIERDLPTINVGGNGPPSVQRTHLERHRHEGDDARGASSRARA